MTSPPTSGTGSTPQPTTPATTGGTSAGGATGGASPGGLLAGTGMGGGVGGLSGGNADAGASAGTPGDAGFSGDAAVPAMDGGVALPDGGLPDAAIDSGIAPDAGDAGCAQLSADAGLCPSFGCRTREQLRTAVGAQGACSSEQAIALACDGRVGKAALECTQESVFSISLERSVTVCLKRDAAIAQLSNDCLGCYVDEALCTLSRCFAACTLTEGSDCKACRQQQCGAPFARCSGLPSPTF